MNPLLTLASAVYHIGFKIDRALKSKTARRLPRPVVSIGNLTVGGTGKTPLLLRLLEDLQKKSIQPAVLSRGYRGIGQSDGINDESLLVKEKFPAVPIGLGKDRAQSAALLKKDKVDLFILDDGFQHWKLQRDIDIVCLDATHLWGGDALLPAGRLREPKTGLRRATLIVLTRCELVETDVIERHIKQIQAIAPSVPILKSRFQLEIQSAQTGEPLSIKGKNVLGVCAIGNPKAFQKNIEDLGAAAQFNIFPDHMAYTQETLDRLEKRAKDENRILVTTEKDWIKMKSLSWGSSCSVPVGVARLQMDFATDQDKWNAFVDEKIKTLC